MKGLFLSVSMLMVLASAIAQDSVKKASADEEAYLAKKKTAKGLIIGGSVSMGVGLLAFSAAALVATAELTTAAWGGGVENEEEITAGAIIGTVLFFGGAGVLVAGLITNGTANKMKASGLSMQPCVPPVQIGNVHRQQQGLTLQWAFPRK